MHITHLEVHQHLSTRRCLLWCVQESLCSLKFAAKVNGCETAAKGGAKRNVTQGAAAPPSLVRLLHSGSSSWRCQGQDDGADRVAAVLPLCRSPHMERPPTWASARHLASPLRPAQSAANFAELR